jgi:hypothetical protein
MSRASSGHDGVSSDDRAYLLQLVGSTTALSPADAERRVDNGIANAKAALNRSGRSTIILAFSLATALLLGAVAAWAAACFGGRHRDGVPLPDWMVQCNRLARRRIVIKHLSTTASGSHCKEPLNKRRHNRERISASGSQTQLMIPVQQFKRRPVWV